MCILFSNISSGVFTCEKLVSARYVRVQETYHNALRIDTKSYKYTEYDENIHLLGIFSSD